MVRKMFVEDKILIGGDVYLLPKMANRHGLIAGATGTGKTITLKTLAESFSDMGVPVFLADMKGDISGLAKVGEMNDNVAKRVEGIDSFKLKSYPVEFWDLFGEKGLPVRVTLSEMGPVLLSKILNLTEAQSGVLNIVFRVADEESLLIIDIKDLKSMINYVVEHKDVYEPKYGSIAAKSANTILRNLITLEDQGGNDFFGEPPLFPPKVSGDFAPQRRVPFINRIGECVVLEPVFRPFHEIEKERVFGSRAHSGLVFFLSNPRDGGNAIGINRHIAPFLFQQGEPMNECQKFAHIVGGVIERPNMKNLCTGFGIYTAILHHARFHIAGGIYGKTFQDRFFFISRHKPRR